MNEHFRYRIGSVGNILGRPPNFYPNSDLLKSGCTFASVYSVREEDAKAIVEAGTCEGFKGIVWSQRLWVDFDTYEAARESEQTLKRMELDYVVYDTGGRGMHIGILRDTAPSHILPRQDKEWVRTNLPGADLSLYWHLHLIRLPGTVHEKTGRRKEFLRRSDGKSLLLPKEQAEVRTSSEGPGIAGQGVQRPSIFREWTVMQLLQPTGQRRQLVLLAQALRKDVGVTAEEALWVVGEVNRGFDIPRDSSEIDRMVKWAYEQ